MRAARCASPESHDSAEHGPYLKMNSRPATNPSLFRQCWKCSIRLRRWNSDAKRAYLSPGGLIEFDRAADVGSGLISISPERKGRVPIRCEIQGVSRDLRARVIAHDHWYINRLRGSIVDGDTGMDA